jgi:small-conductance mechanosensitive channel
VDAQPEILTEAWLRSNAIAIVVTLAVALVLTIAARLIVRRLGRRLDESGDADDHRGGRRTATVTHTLMNTFLAVIWAVTVLVVLGQLGVNVAPLIASAGIAGVALGFGAQTLVRDGLSGFFILLEDQFGIGDTVDVHTGAGIISGRVEAFTLRVTSVRMYDGALNYIPNGNIQVVANKSRG